jgi:hypothetical protein
MSKSTTDVLVERGNGRVVHKVVRNTGARFSLAGYEKLTTLARYDRKLTVSLGQRSDIPRQYFFKLLEMAPASVRSKLEAANPQAAAAIRVAVDDVVTAMQRDARKVSGAARYAKYRFKAQPVTETNVHGPARAGIRKDDGCAGQARRLLDRPGRARPARRGRGHDPDFGQGRWLLLEYGQRSVADVCRQSALTPDDLSQAFERYKKLSQETASNILKFHKRRMELLAQKSAQAAKETERSAAGKPSAGKRVVARVRSASSGVLRLAKATA